MAINTLNVVQQNSNYTAEYWDKRLLGMIALERQNFVFSTLGVEKSIEKNGGTKTISWRRYNALPVSSDLSAEKLAEGAAPTPLKIEAQKVQGTINQYGAYIEETDVVDVIHDDDIKNVYQPELSRHAAEVIERDILASLTDTSEYFVGLNTDIDDLDNTDVISMQDVRKVALKMKNHRRNGHSKFGNKPVLVVHTNIMQDLLDDKALEDKMLVPGNDNSPIKAGTLQQYLVYGFYIIETLIAEVETNSGGYNVYTSYLLGRDPYAVIKLGGDGVKFYNVPFVASHSEPLAQKASFGYKLWTGAKVLDPLAITKIYSTSAYDVALPNFGNDPLGRAALQLVMKTITIDATLAQTAKGEKDTLTATVKDEDNDTATSIEDGYAVVWTSSAPTVATVKSTGMFTAEVEAIKATSGTATITAKLVKRTAAGDVEISSDTCAYTLTIG